MKVQQLKQPHPSHQSCEPRVSVPVDVDFVGRFPSNHQFFWQNHRILRTVLHGSASCELSATTTAIEMKTKNPEHAHSTLFGRFLYHHCMTNHVKLD